MADILSFRDDPHQGVETLLPWYATGQLEAEDAAAVDAHLAACPECRATLEREQRLKAHIGGLPLHADLGWEKLQRRLAPEARDRQERARRHWPGLGWPAALTAFAGAQMAALACALLLLRPAEPAADYRTLGAAAAPAGGNLLIMMRPDTPEEQFRFTLARAGARLVDGPTAAGAYVLAVEPSRRDAALADLRAQPAIMLAQPIGDASR